MALKGKVATAVLTDVGAVRDNNEDAVIEDADLGLMMVADGMGGYNAGEIASGIATTTVLDVMHRELPKLKRGQIDKESGYSVETLLLRKALETAHATIHQVSQSQPQCAGMGTTAVACLFHDDRVSIAYAGDSRLYRIRGQRIEQVTRDHSLVEELIARGFYTREEATERVQRNIVTRALGVEEAVDVELIEEGLEVGDFVMLCSDGLTNMLSDEEIRLTIAKFADNLSNAAGDLVRKANEKGGRDNVSVALARVDTRFPLKRPWWERLIEWF